MLKLLASLWRFLVRLVVGKTDDEADFYSVYKPGQRLIYKYWNGKDWVFTDPMVIYQKMAAVGPELYIDMKLSESISKDAPLGRRNLLKKIRDIFDVKLYEEGGLTQTETVNLLFHFITYCEWIKKNSSLLPTPVVAPSPSTPQPSSPDVAPTTPPSSDSGSSKDEPSSGPPEPLPTEPQ